MSGALVKLQNRSAAGFQSQELSLNLKCVVNSRSIEEQMKIETLQRLNIPSAVKGLIHVGKVQGEYGSGA